MPRGEAPWSAGWRRRLPLTREETGGSLRRYRPVSGLPWDRTVAILSNATC
jgi:hypothetical protein